MTEDAKPGLRLGPSIKEAVQDAKLQGFEVDDAVANRLFSEAGIGRLAHLDRGEPIGDDNGIGSTDFDGSDDGSLF
ncbi:MAG: hypothetical protein KDJ77_10010 [Rhodobiaceae bacterium]|nr:hypothetical protein [Rhodobiaceae bacterium]